MENWLPEQIKVVTETWAQAVSKHYPQYAPMWKDADLHLENIKSTFFPALAAIDLNDYLPSRDARVLEIGSGGGWLTAILSQLPQVAGIEAVDCDEYNLKTLMPAVVERLGGNETKIRAVLGLFDPILAEGAAYDLIVASSSIHHASNLFGTLREMRRVLKDDGFLLILNEMPRDDYHDYQLAIIYHILKDSLRGNSSEFSPGISNAGILYDATLGDHAYGMYQYGNALSAAGFEFQCIDTGHLPNQHNLDVKATLKHFICKPRVEGTQSISELHHVVDPAIEGRIRQVMNVCGEGIDYAEQIAFYKQRELAYFPSIARRVVGKIRIVWETLGKKRKLYRDG